MAASGPGGLECRRESRQRRCSFGPCSVACRSGCAGWTCYPEFMATLVEQVTKDIADAMRQKNQATLAPLRMLKAALMNREVEKGRALDEAESLQVVSQAVKQRRDAVEQFRAGGRDDLADREQAEIAFL